MKEINNTNARDGSRLRATPLNSNTHLTRLRQVAAEGVIAVVLACASVSSASAQTIVSGIIAGETWTKTGSPYFVTGDILVASLTIQPGVQVMFQGNYAFEVAGVVTAVGTAAEPIVLTTTNAGVGWQGVFFNGSSPGSLLAYCRIERSKNSAVRIDNPTPTIPVVIRDCIFATNSAQYGGGLRCTGSGDLELSNCQFLGNSATTYGGGLYMAATGNLSLSRCVFQNNTATPRGGGAYLAGSGSATLTGCTFLGNSVSGGTQAAGGGICCSSDLTIIGSTFDGNVATVSSYNSCQSFGGGIYADTARFYNSTIIRNSIQAHAGGQYAGTDVRGGGVSANQIPQMLNTVVVSNSVAGGSFSGSGTQLGAGVYLWSSVTSSVVNCTFIGNSPQGFNGTANIRNSIFWRNNSSQIAGAAVANYSDVDGGFAGVGNINLNPIVNPANFFLILGSPCVDKGDPEASYNDTCFPPSLGNARNDMGASGGPGACGFLPGTAPTIVAQPGNQSSCLGQSVTFSVATSGTPPFSYQWYHGATLLSGQTVSSLTLTNLQSADAGSYQVVVWNAYGTTNSAPAALVINDACVDLCMYAGLNIVGQPGRIYELRYTTDLSNTNFATWTLLATNTTPWFYIDTNSCGSPKRFYGVKLRP